MKRRELIIGIGIPIIVIVCFLYVLGNNTLVPHSIKLSDCNNSTLKFHLHAPKGNFYALVLATPEIGTTQKLAFRFSGQVRISDKSLTTIEFPIGSDYAVPANWLEREGIPESLILTRDTNCPNFGRLIQASGDYEVEIHFDQPPPASCSIWLHWLQAVKDRGD